MAGRLLAIDLITLHFKEKPWKFVEVVVKLKSPTW